MGLGHLRADHRQLDYLRVELLDDLIDSGDRLGVARLDQTFDDIHAVQDRRVVAAADLFADEGQAAPGRFAGDVHRDLPPADQRLRSAVRGEIAQGNAKVICRHIEDTADVDPARHGCRPFGDGAKSIGAATFSAGLRLRNGAGTVPVFFRVFALQASAGLRLRNRAGTVPVFLRASALQADHPQFESLRAESPYMSGLCPYVIRGGARDSDHSN
jgi:hypothetical protein